MVNKTIILYFFISLGFLGCKKEKVEMPCPEPLPTKWELISGDYKVYDTLGVYLYDMSISHIGTNEFNNDSLKFDSFDGEFTFTVRQANFSNYPMYTTIGFHDNLYDSQGKRWKIASAQYEDYNNFVNDTIRLRFSKTNINYYLLDLVPYYSCDCKQLAVKQH